ncbi:MAG: M23 family metallopeptidase [Bacteroidales bacterium]|jgi:murein DD-endopeptidase MepM/ murein hydrolase activator NlpD|nr:M23 family metallopeptidase [Bacteroidales bacterium]
MAKRKYHFNPISLSFEEKKLSIKDYIYKILGYLATGVAFSTVVIFFAYFFFDSPKEKRYKREMEQYELQLSMINHRLDKMGLALNEIQNRDDQVYRAIFEAEPIPSAVREAGIGGADYYNQYKDLNYSELLEEINMKLDKTASRIYVQTKSLDEIVELTRNKNKMLASIPAIIPIRNGKNKIISGFGMRFHPILKVRRMHTGIDITSPRNTPVYASGDGVVAKSGTMSGYGIAVQINHGYGYQSLYAHLSKSAVRAGQKVKRGELIGYVGNTGLSVSPHLHYEVIKNNVKVNPVNFFFNDLTPEEFEEVLEIASRENQSLS